MSVTSQTPFNSFTAAPGATVFSTEFRVILASDLVVKVAGATVSSGFTVAGLGAAGGVDVTFSTPMTGGEKVELLRIVPLTRATDYQQLGDFLSPVVNQDFDRLWMSQQDQEFMIGGAMRLPFPEQVAELPAAADRVRRLFYFDETGAPVMFSGTPGTVLGFNSSGDPVAVVPADGSAGTLALLLASRATTGQGSGGVGHNGALNYVAGTLGAAVNDLCVNVKSWGAVGDGVTDDAPAFIAAYTANPGKAIYMPDPPVAYLIGSQLTLPAGTVIYGQTRKKTKLLHAHNGVFANLGDGAGFVDCWIDGQGATFTGGCFVFSGTNGHQIRRGLRVSGFDGPIEEFAVAAGSQSIAIDVRYSRLNASSGTDRYAVVIDPAQQLSAVPRKFIGVDTDGQCSFDFGGCNDTFISASFLGDVKFTQESRGVLLTGSRIANQTALTVDGHNNAITGCNIAPQITIANGADAISVQGNTYNNPPVIDNSGNGRNLIDHWAVSYVPNLGSGGVAPSIGNGAIVGKASRSGSTGRCTIELTIGSTTNLGTGDLRFSIPTWMPNCSNIVQYCGVAVMTRGSVFYEASIQMEASEQFVRVVRDTTGALTFNTPATWAAGDVFRLTFEYDIG